MKANELFKKGKQQIYIEIELFKQNRQTFIYIKEEGSTGVELKVYNTKDIMKELENYLKNRD